MNDVAICLSVSLHSVGLCAPARRPLGNFLLFSLLLSHLLFRAPPDSVPQFVSLRAHLPAYPPCRPPSLSVRQALASLSLFLSLLLTLTVSWVNFRTPRPFRKESLFCLRPAPGKMSISLVITRPPPTFRASLSILARPSDGKKKPRKTLDLRQKSRETEGQR